MKTRIVVIFCLIMVCSLIGCSNRNVEKPFAPLSTALFADPPLEARPGVLWPWLNGYFDRNQLVYELEQMKAKGLRGPIIWDVGSLADPLKMIPVGPAFTGSESLEAIRLVLDEGERLGLEVGLFASSSWNAGGPWIGPEDASKAIISSELQISGPAQYRDTLPDPPGVGGHFSEISVFAVPVKSNQSIVGQDDILNISELFDGKTLIWSVPEGEWRVIRFISNNTGQPLMCPSPNSSGPMIDHLSSAATEKHISHLIESIRGDRTGFGALATLMLDSYEVDPANDWTPGFRDEFKKLAGYDPLNLLPALAEVVIENQEFTNRFLHDYHKAVGTIIVNNHFIKTRDILNKSGLKLLAEAGHGGYARVEPLKGLGEADIAMGEFWNGSEFWVTKEAASAVHIYGKTLVNAESFTGWRSWVDGPMHYKRLFDVALCEGLNQVTFHTFAHNPPEAGLPGFVYHAGEHFNVNTTWWEYSGPMLRYMSRASYLLQQGQFVGDLCLYIGDQAPNLVPPRRIDPNITNKYDSTQCGHCEKPKPVSTAGLGQGYDYDYVNEDVILNRMSVVNGRLSLPKELSYRVMVLPDKTTISPEVLKKPEKLIRAGAVVVGPKPLRSNSLINYPACDEEVRKLGEKIWGSCDGENVKSNPYGKGKVYYGLPLRAILKELGVEPDFQAEGFDNSDQHIDYIHRRTRDEDIYFVSNSALHREKFTARFRVSSQKVPYLWMADNGKIYPCEVLGADDQFTTIELDLPPCGSVFVVFSPAGSAFEAEPEALIRGNLGRTVATFDNPWTITFPEGRGAPGEIKMGALTDWTHLSDDGVKHFSGTATYRTTFAIPDSLAVLPNGLLLDLGEVKEVAVVRVNGVVTDTLWKQPYLTRITDLVKPGINSLEIDVTNLWHNRLVGDAGKVEAERTTRTNIQGKYRKEMPLLSSGLIGPVSIVAEF
ncbi:MAG: glycosyl hydrolase [Bacteroidales bacterium]